MSSHNPYNIGYVVADKNGGSEKGSYLLEKVLHGYKIKSTSKNSLLCNALCCL